MTIVEFLSARISEREIAARRAAESVRGERWEARPGADVVAKHASPGLVTTVATCNPGGGHLVAEHIASHDPQRVLAECVASRQILEAHPLEPAYTERGLLGCAVCNKHPFMNGVQTLPGICDTLLALASVYAEHPDWTDDWNLRP